MSRLLSFDPTGPSTRSVPVQSGLTVPAPGRVRLAGFVLFTALAADAWQSLLGWPAFIVLVVGLTAASAVVLVRSRRSIEWVRQSKPLAAFVLFSAVSIVWSHYAGATALGIAAQWLAVVAGLFIALALSWLELVRALGTALRFILGLSLVFELYVSLVVRAPLHALWLFSGGRGVPPEYEWSTASLLNGGPIQGIVGNRNLLAMLVLLALIVFSIEWAQKTRPPVSSALWLGLALVEHALTRSATVLMATVGVAFVLVLALQMRRVPPAKRGAIYPLGVLGLAAVAFATVELSDRLFPLLGKSNDLTGRVDIWNTVLGLAWQHPVAGWGWVSYWAPWAEPFKGLVVIDGTEYLQAHNAWVDLFLQVGVVGVALFACLLATAAFRAWRSAVLPSTPAAGAPVASRALSLLPLLVITALAIQSLTESRLLLEGNFVLLVALATKVKVDRLSPGPSQRAAAR